jgi:hypothetical protein
MEASMDAFPQVLMVAMIFWLIPPQEMLHALDDPKTVAKGGGWFLNAWDQVEHGPELGPGDRLVLSIHGPGQVPWMPGYEVDGVATTPNSVLARVVSAAIGGTKEAPIVPPGLRVAIFVAAEGWIVVLVIFIWDIRKQLFEFRILVDQAAADEGAGNYLVLRAELGWSILW